jgi:hypothetical protein
MRHVLLATTMLLAMAGCTPDGPYWARPGATPAQFDVARAACETTANKRYPPVSLGVPGYFAAPNSWCGPTSGGTNCLIVGQGYLPQARGAGDTNDQPREAAFQSCMMTVGWRPVSNPAEAHAIDRSVPRGAVAR